MRRPLQHPCGAHTASQLLGGSGNAAYPLDTHTQAAPAPAFRPQAAKRINHFRCTVTPPTSSLVLLCAPVAVFVAPREVLGGVVVAGHQQLAGLGRRGRWGGCGEGRGGRVCGWAARSCCEG